MTPDPRKIEAALTDYLRREGVEVFEHSGSFHAASSKWDEEDGVVLVSIDLLRLAEVAAEAA